jgi:hypothetical protein
VPEGGLTKDGGRDASREAVVSVEASGGQGTAGTAGVARCGGQQREHRYGSGSAGRAGATESGWARCGRIGRGEEDGSRGSEASAQSADIHVTGKSARHRPWNDTDQDTRTGDTQQDSKRNRLGRRQKKLTHSRFQCRRFSLWSDNLQDVTYSLRACTMQ